MGNLSIGKKDGKLSVRIPQKRMNNVQRILQKKRLTHSDAINIFYEFVEKINDFPFKIEIKTSELNAFQKIYPRCGQRASLKHLKRLF